VWWAAHVKAQRDSGQSQVAYCRARGLDPKYFTLWKRRQHGLRVSAKPTEAPGLIPVVVRADRMALAPATPRGEPTHEPAAIVALRLSLGNGISLSLEVAAAAIPTLVRELAGLRC
jgi:hypothetical protein